ncbi:MAG TPA: site-specific integrase [Pseudonocardiaceae bacterium]|nr:site-specific integrase [Pseudonocardiaceae bacterium]
MAGHIQDRWYQPKRDSDGKVVRDAKGRVVKESSPLHGTGMRYKVRYPDPSGRERSEMFPDKQLSRAKAFLAKQQHDVLSGTYLDPDAGKLKFREYSATVMLGRSRDESSVQTWAAVLKNLVYPNLGDLELVAIGTDAIRKWLGWMNGQDRPPAQSYQRQAYDLVSSILEAAVADQRIRANPCRDKSIRRPAVGPKKVTPWPESKMWKIELALSPRDQVAVTLGAGLGLRQGEIFAFSMDNVDRVKMVYRCSRQVVKVGSVQKFKFPKGHKERDIPLGLGVLETLDAYAENYPPVSVTLPWGEQDGRKYETVNVLVTDDESELHTARKFNTGVWIPAFARAGLDYQQDYSDGMHALRHLFASSMLHQGVSIKELAAFLGHADEAFTLRTYVHLMPNSYERARLAVDAMFKPRRQAVAIDPSTG